MKLNAEKSKIMKFKREVVGLLNKKDWRWKGKKIEEVKKFAT